MRTGVYQIRNLIDGKRYIGSAAERRGFKQRWSSHKTLLRRNGHYASYLQNAWNKYGEDSFAFEILIYCNPEDCLSFEQIALDTYQPEYNTLKIAGSPLGREVSQITKDRISDALTGKKLSQEHKTKISELKKGNQYWLGKKHSEQSKYKISQAKRGVVLSVQHKDSIRRSCLQNTIRGEGHHRSRLTKNDVIEIRRLLQQGILQGVIACKFSIPQSLVSKIKNRKLWRSV